MEISVQFYVILDILVINQILRKYVFDSDDSRPSMRKFDSFRLDACCAGISCTGEHRKKQTFPGLDQLRANPILTEHSRKQFTVFGLMGLILLTPENTQLNLRGLLEGGNLWKKAKCRLEKKVLRVKVKAIRSVRLATFLKI